MDNNFIAGSSPHIHSKQNVRSIMLDVIIALMPAALAGIYFFGLKAFLLMIVTVASCVASEFVWCNIVKKENTIYDLSAVVTGLLLSFNLSSEVPLWIAAIGGIFAIIIVKQLFGGLGHNFVNPALAARAFLMASWPVQMTTWKLPVGVEAVGSATSVDAVSSATPLALLKMGSSDKLPDLLDMFLGRIGGCIGETSALALLLGAVYLVARKVITLETPLAFIGTVGFMTWMLGGEELFTGQFMYYILGGGLLLGAFFMATDYTTSPVTAKGRLIMGVGCGILTSVIRLYGGYPEGVSYSILLMNLVVPMIDRYLVHKSFGGGAVKNA